MGVGILRIQDQGAAMLRLRLPQPPVMIIPEAPAVIRGPVGRVQGQGQPVKLSGQLRPLPLATQMRQVIRGRRRVREKLPGLPVQLFGRIQIALPGRLGPRPDQFQAPQGRCRRSGRA